VIHLKNGPAALVSDLLEWVGADKANGRNFVQNHPGFFLLSGVELRQTRTGKEYYEATIHDAQVAQKVKIWDWKHPPQSGKLVVADYEYSPSYGLSLHLTSELFELSLLAEKNPELLSLLVPAANTEQLWKELEDLRAQVHDPYLRKLLHQVFAPPWREKWQTVPAAVRNHHVRVGGLLQHSVQVAQLCLQTAQFDFAQNVDKDLLLAGALLHDLGKLQSYSSENAVAFELTDQGKLEDHIVVGIKILARSIDAIPGFPAELESLLTHILVSHHGLKEWGSAVVPKTLEAIIVHNCDRLEAQMDAFHSSSRERSAESGKWSSYNRMLGSEVLFPQCPFPETEQEETK